VAARWLIPLESEADVAVCFILSTLELRKFRSH